MLERVKRKFNMGKKGEGKGKYGVEELLAFYMKANNENLERISDLEKDLALKTNIILELEKEVSNYEKKCAELEQRAIELSTKLVVMGDMGVILEDILKAVERRNCEEEEKELDELDYLDFAIDYEE